MIGVRSGGKRLDQKLSGCICRGRDDCSVVSLVIDWCGGVVWAVFQERTEFRKVVLQEVKLEHW